MVIHVSCTWRIVQEFLLSPTIIYPPYSPFTALYIRSEIKPSYPWRQLISGTTPGKKCRGHSRNRTLMRAMIQVHEIYAIELTRVWKKKRKTSETNEYKIQVRRKFWCLSRNERVGLEETIFQCVDAIEVEPNVFVRSAAADSALAPIRTFFVTR